MLEKPTGPPPSPGAYNPKQWPFSPVVKGILSMMPRFHTDLLSLYCGCKSKANPGLAEAEASLSVSVLSNPKSFWTPAVTPLPLAHAS